MAAQGFGTQYGKRSPRKRRTPIETAPAPANSPFDPMGGGQSFNGPGRPNSPTPGKPAGVNSGSIAGPPQMAGESIQTPPEHNYTVHGRRMTRAQAQRRARRQSLAESLGWVDPGEEFNINHATPEQLAIIQGRRPVPHRAQRTNVGPARTVLGDEVDPVGALLRGGGSLDLPELPGFSGAGQGPAMDGVLPPAVEEMIRGRRNRYA